MDFAKKSRQIIYANRFLFAFLLLMTVFRSAFADWVQVPSGSMNPTIVEGDRIFVDKLVFGLRIPFTTVHLTEGTAPERGDIVVFDSPKTGITLIKRIIGIPGDVLEMRRDDLFINGVPLRYQATSNATDADMLASTRGIDHEIAEEVLPGRSHAIMVLPDREAMRDFGPVVIAPGRYFMMGDNRDNSEDSRFIGTVSRDAIVGRASRVVVSLDPEHAYLPRLTRIFKHLD
jgi:signal peptidase I